MPNKSNSKELTLKNVGPFDERGLKIKFEEKDKLDNNKANIHILVGENGSGKSTVLKGLFFTLFGNERSKLVNSSNDCFFDGFDPHDKYYDNLYDLWQLDKKPVFYYTPNESLIRFDERTYSPKNKDSGNNLIKNWVITFNDVDYLDKIRYVENNRNALLANDKKKSGEKLNNKQLNSIESEIEITKKIEKFVKSIYNIDFRYKYKSISEGYKPYFDGKYFEFYQLSLGYRQIISLVTDVLLKVWDAGNGHKNLKIDKNRETLPFFLILDEIDIHLHPKAQRRILPALQEMFPNAEIFCTTHSPFVVNSVSDAWVYKIDKKHGEVEPRESSDGDSYMYSMLEDFGVSAEYGEDAQKKLERFDALVRLAKNKQEYDKAEFENLKIELINKSEEIEQIVIFESNKIK